ncbi:hypothetical protein FV226_07645 [Methylobacterium sp. WL12]|uniref:hypothetical protein n=1 Tax=Methylobacterium sp. WL12 TaxID=2603890 RepID=UPI0011C82923|nr:hypothetical protein [Methylobacterium sp. WL12]TXM74141.1 hypothetical protein FV226_07645 [Methylobacterium sp. WL12]
MTVQERDTRDARLFAADALREARSAMASPPTEAGYFMAVFTLLAVGAMFPAMLAEPDDSDD